MSLDVLPRPLPLLSHALPGTGGASKVAPEDFEVEEIPAYLPTGEGEHLYLWVEKRGLTTSEAARLIAKATNTKERDIGYAGQKDRFAITRQWMSVHTKADTVTLEDDRAVVLSAIRHRNRLKVGHLKGNRFRVVLRGVGADAANKAQATLDLLEQEGLPNFYGQQRFGRAGDNALVGAALLGLAEHPYAQRAGKDRHLRRLSLSALQSELFNRCLTARLADGLFAVPILGDVLRKRTSGGVFTCDDPSLDAPRVTAGELDVTGPMPGPKERPAALADALERENRVLAEAGVRREDFAKGGAEAEGTRRPYRVPVSGIGLDVVAPDALAIRFELPSGSYATRILEEVAKTVITLPSEG